MPSSLLLVGLREHVVERGLGFRSPQAKQVRRPAFRAE